MSSRELGYFALHLYHILYCWSYQLAILFAYKILYCCFSPGTKAYLDHEYKIVSGSRGAPYLQTLFRVFPRLRDLWLLTRPDRSSQFNGSSNLNLTLTKHSRLRAERADTPSAAFHRIIHIIHLLHTSTRLSVLLGEEMQHFWRRGITGASKPDYYLLGGKWHIKDLPDPREELENDPLLCAIAASTGEQMVENFNWRIGLGIRRDLRVLRVRKPYWDKNLLPCMMESTPEWCKDVGPVQVQTIVDRKVDEDTARHMLAIGLSPSFKKRNLLACSQFMYFA